MAIDIKGLWVGDEVRLIKSGRIGKFEGIDKSQKARIKIDNKIVLSEGSNLELYIPPKQDPVIKSTNINSPKKVNPIASLKLKDEIDLHIEALNPSMVNNKAEMIIAYQIKSAKEFIENAIKNRTAQITIIHGKGEGVLKLEVLHLLTLYVEVKFTFDKNNGGATEVWLG